MRKEQILQIDTNVNSERPSCNIWPYVNRVLNFDVFELILKV